MGKYKTVVIDPAWPIRASERGGSIPTSMQDSQLKAELPYETMSIDEIRSFPIDDFAAEEALLFMWVTSGKAVNGEPILKIGMETLECWGFEYHTILTWQKTNPYALWSPIQWATEHILFGYRGNFPTLTGKQYGVMKSFFTAPTTTHSTKPSLLYRTLRGWTPKPRVDVLGRLCHEGFDGWGNEYVGNSDEGTLLQYLKDPTLQEPASCDGNSHHVEEEPTKA